MKTKVSNPAAALMMLLLVFTFFVTDAQPAPVNAIAASINTQAAPVDVVPAQSVKFQVSIPEDLASKIVRENADNAVYFKFQKSDGTSQFLFQVNKVSEYEWAQLKDQLSNAKVLARKNGFVYFTLATDKRRIKGSDAAAYEQVYARLNQITSSVVITE